MKEIKIILYSEYHALFVVVQTLFGKRNGSSSIVSYLSILGALPHFRTLIIY